MYRVRSESKWDYLVDYATQAVIVLFFSRELTEQKNGTQSQIYPGVLAHFDYSYRIVLEYDTQYTSGPRINSSFICLSVMCAPNPGWVMCAKLGHWCGVIYNIAVHIF